jgi:hypothetical protein
VTNPETPELLQTAELIAIRDLRPNDVLVVRVNTRLTTEQADHISNHMEELLGEGVKVVVVDRDVSFEVLRQTPEVTA